MKLKSNNPTAGLFNAFDNKFGSIIVLLSILNYLVYDIPQVAMWFGFGLAGLSAIGNDSLQTLGTFIASNRRLPKWLLILFTGSILIVTLAYSWFHYNGDISYGRLSEIPQPSKFSFFELSAPIILLLMTRLQMPVSTTFLLLSVFSSHFIIKQMIIKSILGYILAFICAYGLWSIFSNYFKNHLSKIDKKSHQRIWRSAQFIVTGFLWSLWIMHDMANIVVFLPRTLSLYQLLLVLSYLFLVVSIVLYIGGGKIQKIVDEKSSINNVYSATIVDVLYLIVLIIFKEISQIPMSTTWVFIGLLGGRELAYQHFIQDLKNNTQATKLIFKDFFRAGLGLIISIVISLMI